MNTSKRHNRAARGTPARHRFYAGVFIALLAIGATAPAYAQRSDAPQEYSIQAGSLDDALKQLAAQNKLQIAYSPDLVRGKTVPGLSGRHTWRAALQQLLRGTGLEWGLVNDSAVVIRKAPVKPVIPEERVNHANPLTVTEMDAIVVTGTRIRGTASDSSPLAIYSRQDIERSGVGTIAQFARQMPQNFASVDSLLSGSASSGINQGGANNNFGTGFNLKGLGPGATLTLLNGHRLAPAGVTGSFADVSLIPMVAVERVEVLSDGASAIYGADAIAGVVNIILKRNYSGAQSSLRAASSTEGGAETITAAQMVGGEWNSGNGIIAYEYHKEYGLGSRERDYIPDTGDENTLLPSGNRQSLFASVQQDIWPGTTLSFDGIYSHRESHQTTYDPTVGIQIDTQGDAKQYGGTAALTSLFANDWRMKLTSGYYKIEQPRVDIFPLPIDLFDERDADNSQYGAGIQFDGTLIELPSGGIKVAIGADYRRENLAEEESTRTLAGVETSSRMNDYERSVWSGYTEVLVPVFGPRDSQSRHNRLELSIAARYDRYSDFGHSFNPKFGFVAAPSESVRVRATYGRSFRAPELVYLNGLPFNFTQVLPDASSPSGNTATLILSGAGNPSVAAEKSRSFTVGIDLTPRTVPGFSFSTTYFDVSFRDRILQPPLVGGSPAGVFSQPALAPFINHEPSAAEIDAIFAMPRPVFDFANVGPGGVEAIFDFRPQNIAATKQTGIEFLLRYDRPTSIGEIGLSVAGQRLFSTDLFVLPTLPSVAAQDRIGSPAKTKLNGTVSWARGAFSASFSANYVGGYENTLVSPTQRIDSWLTNDLWLSYRFSRGAELDDNSGLTMSLAIRNLFNSRPPFAYIPRLTGAMVYDAANADPIGRVVALQITKNW